MTEVVPDGTVEVRHDGTPETDCDCNYIITDINGVSVNSFFELTAEIEGFTCEEVTGSTICGDRAFEGQFSLQDCYTGNPNACIDDLSGVFVNQNPLDPTSPLVLAAPVVNSLNCSVPDSSIIDVEYVAFFINAFPDCAPNGTLLEDFSITFHIACTQTEIGGTCPGVSYVSDPITFGPGATGKASVELV